MSDAAWVALATLGFLVVSGFLGWLLRCLHQLGTKIDVQTAKLTEMLDQHEQKDQERYEDQIQRLTRVETKVETLANGNGRAKRNRA